MSSPNLRHPEDGQLLLYLDGETGRRHVRGIQCHLEACWQCRSELESLQAAVNECVRYRKQVLIPNVPAPPVAWGSLDFATADAELAGESLTARLGRWLSPRRSTPLRWVLSGAMALALGLVIVRQLRETPNVEAAALLRKAVEISASRPQPVKRLRIVSSRGSLTRMSGGVSIRPAAGEAEIARLFEEYKKTQEQDLKDIKTNARKREDEQEALILASRETLHKLKWALKVKENVKGAQ